MIRLEEKYEQALQFRKRGFTYSEIAKIVGVSKSTVSNWVSKKAFSKKVRLDNTERAARDNVKRIGLINKARATERIVRYLEAEHSAETEYRHYKNAPLFIAGLMTYICHGDCSITSRIRVTSSKFLAHRAFIQFAEAYLGVSKHELHFWLLLYADYNENKQIRLWSKQIGVSVAQFHKTQILQQKTKIQALQHGTGNTIIGNTVLKRKLLRWIELFSKDMQ